MKKSLLALLLALAMLTMLFAGCGNAATSAAEAAASAVQSAAEGAAEAAEDAAEAAEDAAEDAAEAVESALDAEAEEVEYEGNPPIEYPLVDEPTTLTYWQAWPPFLNEISAPDDAAMF